MNNKGFTFAEIIISVAILGIFTIPVIVTFFCAARNHNAALEIYEASLFAQNMVVEVRTALDDIYDLEDFLAGDDYQPLSKIVYLKDEFRERFKTDTYTYDVYIVPFDKTDEKPEYVFTTRSKDVPEPQIKPIDIQSKFMLAHEIAYNPYDGKELVILYDNGFETIKSADASVSYDDNNCRIKFESAADYTNALIEIKSMDIDDDINIALENNSNGKVYMTIERDYKYKDKITLNADKNVFVTASQAERPRYFIFLDIYGADDRLLINFIDIL